MKSLQLKLRIALEYYIETRDFRGGARITEMGVDEFVYFAKEKANIYDLNI